MPMRFRSFVKPLSAVFLALLLATCATVPDQPRIPPTVNNAGPTPADINSALATMAIQSASSSSDYQIGPEDMLQVTLFNIITDAEAGTTPRTVTVRVNQQGLITLPLLGDISVKGLTVSRLERALRERYDKYIYNPQVGVLVTEFRQRVSVIGAVQRSGVVELTGPKTIIDVLALAGGLSSNASSQVHIYRQTSEGRQSYVIDLSFLTNVGSATAKETELINMPMQVGDVINVPQAGAIFIDGAVKNPGSFPLARRYSLTQALITAGGVDPEVADYSGIIIYRRRSPQEVVTIPANLTEIQRGNLADPLIEPNDVIVVPVSPLKHFVKRYVSILFSANINPFMFGS